MEKRYLILTWLSILFCCVLSGKSKSQSLQSGIFDSEEVLHIRLSGNIRELVKDKGDDMQYHPFTLSYETGDSSRVSIPIQVKTRGNFRRTQGNCTYPPLMFDFSKDNPPRNSLFDRQLKMKLVTPCRGDKYVVREYLVYKLSNLITPKSFRSRLVSVIYDDTVKGIQSEPLYGILLEEEDQMAQRNNAIIIKGKLVKPEQTRSDDFLKMAVFEYMIGNTDWSVQYLQNVKLIASDSLGIASTVPYDFDHAGIVSAPYAKPAEALLLNSIRERRYRGYCINVMSAFDKTFEHFNLLKEDIYGIYSNCPWLEDSYLKSTLKFLDDFYRIINSPKTAKAEFGYPCNANGTGNVVIKGLKKK